MPSTLNLTIHVESSLPSLCRAHSVPKVMLDVEAKGDSNKNENPAPNREGAETKKVEKTEDNGNATSTASRPRADSFDNGKKCHQPPTTVQDAQYTHEVLSAFLIINSKFKTFKLKLPRKIKIRMYSIARRPVSLSCMIFRMFRYLTNHNINCTSLIPHAQVITLWYRPPEILLGEKKYDCSVDLWSTACVIAELFKRGAPMFPGDSEIGKISRKFFFPKNLPKFSRWSFNVEQDGPTGPKLKL
jgi:serine/threonine protein kinase